MADPQDAAIANDIDGDIDNMTREPNPRDAAAIKLQRLWRSRRKKETLDTEARWKDAIIHARIKTGRLAAHEGKNDPKTRWRRAVVTAARLQDGQGLLMQRDDKIGVGIHGKDPMDKQLETQHWLELIDGKHRYGSNLKFYFRKWQEDDTTDNFFRWLDYGKGKDLSLPECSREQLEKERIIYLSAEQRLNYLVKIDPKGRLRWARNNELVDTSAGRWKDLGNGLGIVPTDGTEPIETNLYRRNSFSDSSIASSSEQASHYLDHAVGSGNRISKMLQSRFTTAGLTNRLLRKTVRRNTWIYCSDKHFNLFIGIKNTGTFQHSSFLGGGLVTSAGLISIQDGIIHSLSPLSGHYRTSIQHFREFVEVLDERGAHLGKLKVSKAEGILWGLEHYKKFKKAKDTWLGKQKKRVKSIAKRPRHQDKDQGQGDLAGEKEASNDDQESDGQWRRDILHGRKPLKGKERAGLESTIGTASPEGNEGMANTVEPTDAESTPDNGVVPESGTRQDHSLAYSSGEAQDEASQSQSNQTHVDSTELDIVRRKSDSSYQTPVRGHEGPTMAGTV